jgi:hypothetical protein
MGTLSPDHPKASRIRDRVESLDRRHRGQDDRNALLRVERGLDVIDHRFLSEDTQNRPDRLVGESVRPRFIRVARHFGALRVLMIAKGVFEIVDRSVWDGRRRRKRLGLR